MDMTMTPEQFASKLKQTLPEALHSILLYGSFAAGDFVPGASSHDLIVVLHRLDAAELQALAPAVKDWVRAGNPSPQVFVLAELASAAEVFPLEMLDLQQSRRVLCGVDPLANMVVNPVHLQLQVEHELKGKAQLLRQRYLVAAGQPKRLANLLTDSVSTFLVLFRGALRLYQETVPSTKIEALNALAKYIPFDPQPFLTVLKLKAGDLRPKDVELPKLFHAYRAAVELVVQAVDQHIHPSTSQETVT
jgi:hypothetical protein